MPSKEAYMFTTRGCHERRVHRQWITATLQLHSAILFTVAACRQAIFLWTTEKVEQKHDVVASLITSMGGHKRLDRSLILLSVHRHAESNKRQEMMSTMFVCRGCCSWGGHDRGRGTNLSSGRDLRHKEISHQPSQLHHSYAQLVKEIFCIVGIILQGYDPITGSR
ncbi:hypothetical protein BC939DRAFT_299775 [Gamsiella multidivaricata]|uniref:uncharacterized protein n=1 Tax=Gamsiella multidivaricata TaxID=101098 RepID=UPI00221FC90E|nr:uncharacterized protein BC939DRAFT_299775 [Gamsiella multidivaricata]KAI7818154.1 hypothetical protein BC939DRAFT_299775 [Gamsiella multidivaricata]